MTVGENVLDDLLEARAALGATASQAELVIFAKVGFTPNLITRARNEAVRLIAADELFQA